MAAALAEAQARLNVSLQEIVQFFEENGIEQHSVELLNLFIEKHQTMEFIDLAEGFGKSMAFIDHDELILRLYRSVVTWMEGLQIERKNVTKKLKALKEDKKADPEVINRLENLLVDIDSRKSRVLVSCMRFKVMSTISIQNFRDEKFDYVSKHKAKMEEHKKASKEKK